jgi:putative tryptophan/tyrosine transport system substrate-binding protein
MEKLSSRGLLIGLVFSLLLLVSFGVVAGELKIGVIQIVEHPALDAARQGFVDVLAENGYVEGENTAYDYQNAQGDMSNANTIAQKFNIDRPDLILAIATPTAQAVANVVKDIPILITAVTDPVDAGLVDSAEEPGTNVTGTTDMNPIDRQLELVLKFKPDASRLGIIYNAGESNSVVQVKIAREVAQKLGLKLVEATADSSANVLQVAYSLANRVDAIYVPTDNTVVSAIESVVMVAEEFDLPLIVGEDNSVRSGGLATVGIDYYRLGRQTGEMALRIIDGASPETMPIEEQKEMKLVINAPAAEAMGVTIPDELMEIADEILTGE